MPLASSCSLRVARSLTTLLSALEQRLSAQRGFDLGRAGETIAAVWCIRITAEQQLVEKLEQAGPAGRHPRRRRVRPVRHDGWLCVHVEQQVGPRPCDFPMQTIKVDVGHRVSHGTGRGKQVAAWISRVTGEDPTQP